jgi:hypothetical protein
VVRMTDGEHAHASVGGEADWAAIPDDDEVWAAPTNLPLRSTTRAPLCSIRIRWAGNPFERLVLHLARILDGAHGVHRYGGLRQARATDSQVVMYVARGAFHNPTRDRSQLAGLAKVTSPVRQLRRPVKIADREFVCACSLRLGAVLPERGGVPWNPSSRSWASSIAEGYGASIWADGLIALSREDMELVKTAVHQFKRVHVR